MTEQRKEVPRFLSDALAKCEVSRKSRFLHPYLQLFISVVLTGAAQIFLKLGVDSQFDAPWQAHSILFSPWILAGVIAMLVSLLSWLYALKSLFPLSSHLPRGDEPYNGGNRIVDLSRRGNFNPSLGRYFPGCARHRLYCAAFSSSREEIVTFLLFCLILLYASCSVSGQLFFKHGMSDQVNSPRSRRLLDIAAGVSAMTVGFFVWLALLQRFDLSFLYPFEGLDRVLLALGARLFLREKVTTDLWIGVILICLGTAFGESSHWPAALAI